MCTLNQGNAAECEVCGKAAGNSWVLAPSNGVADVCRMGVLLRLEI